jgi:hypothetical protein
VLERGHLWSDKWFLSAVELFKHLISFHLQLRCILALLCIIHEWFIVNLPLQIGSN